MNKQQTLWAYLPLPMLQDSYAAQYYVGRGWANSFDELYLELSVEQQAQLEEAAYEN